MRSRVRNVVRMALLVEAVLFVFAYATDPPWVRTTGRSVVIAVALLALLLAAGKLRRGEHGFSTLTVYAVVWSFAVLVAVAGIDVLMDQGLTLLKIGRLSALLLVSVVPVVGFPLLLVLWRPRDSGIDRWSPEQSGVKSS